MLIVTIPLGYEPDYVTARKIQKKTKERLTDNQKAVLSYFADHPHASLKEIAQVCGISLGGVKKITGKLQELKFLERRGAKSNSTWIVL